MRHAWLLPILLVAAWLRLVGLSDHHLYGDEAEYAVVARYLSRDLMYLSYPQLEGFGFVPFVSQPPLLLYLMAFSMKVFGPTDFAAVFPSIVLGTASVAVLYFLGLRLAGRFVGVSAAALLAVFPFHVEWSRHASLDAGYTFFVLLSAYLLVAWVQTRRRAHAVGVGVAAACACLSKLPGVLVLPALMGVFLLVLGITAIRQARGLEPRASVRRTLLDGGLGALPVLAGGLAYLALLAALNSLTNLYVKLMWQLGRVDAQYAQVQEVTAFVRSPDFYFSDPQFSFQALMTPAVFALGLVGMGVMLARFVLHPLRETEQLVVPLVAAILLGFFLYSQRKEGFYLLVFAPFAALGVSMSGEGLRRLLRWGGFRLAPRASQRLAPLALAAALLVVAVPSYAVAGESYQHYALGGTQEKYFGYGTREAAEWIHETDPDAIQYGGLLARFSLLWYNGQPAYHWYMDHGYVEGQVEAGRLRYVVFDQYLNLQFDEGYMKELITKYDGRAVATFEKGWGRVTVFELHP